MILRGKSGPLCIELGMVVLGFDLEMHKIFFSYPPPHSLVELWPEATETRCVHGTVSRTKAALPASCLPTTKDIPIFRGRAQLID